MDVMELIARVGGTTKLAAALGITKNAPYQWRKIPPHHVPTIAARFGIPRHEMRPDLWEAPSGYCHAHASHEGRGLKE